MTTVTVSAEHIAAGKRGRCAECPLALAINDLLANGYQAWVSSKVYIDDAAGRLQYASTILATPARRAMENFDLGLTMQPFSFPLDIPARFLRPREGDDISVLEK